MIACEPAADFRYWAFISYSHQDAAWGRWLHRALESYRLPRRLIGAPIAAGRVPARLVPVFRDRDELPSASDLGQAIEEALRQAWCLIVVCSPAAARSRWVDEEVRTFRRLGRTERIYCLLVGDAPAPCYPAALAEAAAAGHEPLAADLRACGDGRRHARLKLVSGILGLRYDDLVRREQQRRHRRTLAAACVAGAASAVLAVATLVAVGARREAEAQRNHAETLVEFMLGDLRRKLEPEGRLAILDAVGQQALAYYAAQDPARLGADALGRRARALHLIGEVDDQRGHLDEALGVFRRAAATTAELLAREPHAGARLFDHAQSVYWVGYIAWRRGHLDEAEQAFLRYQELTGALLAIDPHNADWQAEAEYAHSNLGTLLLTQGRADAAATAFVSALAIAQMLATAAPQDPARRSELAQAHAWVAEALAAQGKLAEAARERETEVALYEAVLRGDAHNREAHAALAVAERKLGTLALARGDVPAATEHLRQAVALAEATLAADIENADSADAAAIAQLDLADALDYANESGAARAAVARAQALALQLLRRDPSVLDWQLRRARVTLAQLRQGNAAAPTAHALRMAQDVLAQLRELDVRSGKRSAQMLRVEALAQIAMIEERLNDAAAAARAWQQVAELAGRDDERTEPDLLAARAQALERLGRLAEAAPLRLRLAAMGYRHPAFARIPRAPASVSGARTE